MSFDERLRKAKGKAAARNPHRAPPDQDRGALGMAWRISIELAVAIGVCAAVGFGFDQWLGTSPWIMLVFLFLGFGAGIRNVYRATQAMTEDAADSAGEQDRRGGGNQ